MHPRTRTALIVLMCLVGATSYALAQKDPFVGEWTLNVAKSKYSPGPAPKDAIATFEVADSVYDFWERQTPARGAVEEWTFGTNFDGKPGKIIGNHPNADMVTCKRIDAMTIETVYSRKGKETTRQRDVVSADGKSRTITTTGMDVTGQKVSDVAVYQRSR